MCSTASIRVRTACCEVVSNIFLAPLEHNLLPPYLLQVLPEGQVHALHVQIYRLTHVLQEQREEIFLPRHCETHIYRPIQKVVKLNCTRALHCPHNRRSGILAEKGTSASERTTNQSHNVMSSLLDQEANHSLDASDNKVSSKFICLFPISYKFIISSSKFAQARSNHDRYVAQVEHRSYCTRAII